MPRIVVRKNSAPSRGGSADGTLSAGAVQPLPSVDIRMQPASGLLVMHAMHRDMQKRCRHLSYQNRVHQSMLLLALSAEEGHCQIVCSRQAADCSAGCLYASRKAPAQGQACGAVQKAARASEDGAAACRESAMTHLWHSPCLVGPLDI